MKGRIGKRHEREREKEGEAERKCIDCLTYEMAKEKIG